jgi:glucose dehydrogenase
MVRIDRIALAAMAVLLASCTAALSAPTVVDGAALRSIDAPAHVGDWLSHGRGWDEARFSPLAQIDEDNVGGRGLGWVDDLET